MEWRTRLLEDIKTNRECIFITLTFSRESFKTLSDQNPNLEGYTLDNWIATKAVRLFLERWRKKYKKSLRHWLVTELGHNGTENVHLHGLLWTKDANTVKQIWQYGYVWAGTYVNNKTINYITKYVNKVDALHKYYNPVILTSAGIGSNYTNTFNAKLNKYKPGQTKETYTTTSGHEINMPIYWKNKIYTDQEREQLWLEKLNKQERWVLGQKIDVSSKYNEYFKAINEARKINERMGYGNDKVDWKQKEYENLIRMMKHNERLRREV